MSQNILSLKALVRRSLSSAPSTMSCGLVDSNQHGTVHSVVRCLKSLRSSHAQPAMTLLNDIAKHVASWTSILVPSDRAMSQAKVLVPHGKMVIKKSLATSALVAAATAMVRMRALSYLPSETMSSAGELIRTLCHVQFAVALLTLRNTMMIGKSRLNNSEPFQKLS